MKTTSKSALTLTEILTALSAVALVATIIGALCLPAIIGTFPFGPERTVEAKVTRLYVDYSGGKEHSQSHYMVGTDQGVFEVDNSWWAGIFNADELYSKLEQGKRYRITIKGNKYLNAMSQTYPGVIAVEEIRQ